MLADEIMCGLGRHGQGKLFLTDSWGIEPDCVTFGKAIAAGAFPMSGAVLARGAAELNAAGAKLGQSHTYAAASPRALLAATSTLREIPKWSDNIAAAADALGDGLERAAAATNGKVVTHGLGLMRGAVFVPSVGPEDRVAAAAKLKAHCRDAGVWPRAAKGCESLNFEGSYLSQFPLVSAHFWTSDHLSSSSRTVNAFSDRIDR